MDVSVVVISRPGDFEPRALQTWRQLGCPGECWWVRGHQPAAQRNAGARKARGRWLVFWDDDVELDAVDWQLWREAMLAADQAPSETSDRTRAVPETVGILGVGSLVSGQETLASLALSSRWLAGAAAARYRVGSELDGCCDDRALIGCGLAVRRDVWEVLGGMDERLFPNEENDFMERAQRAGFDLWRVGRAAVRRPARKNLGQMVRQLFRYGRGRGRQNRLAGNGFRGVLLAVAGYAVIGGLVPVWMVVERWMGISTPWNWIDILVLSAWIAPGLMAAVEKGRLGLIWAVPVGLMAYGLGLWMGWVFPYRAGVSDVGVQPPEQVAPC